MKSKRIAWNKGKKLHYSVWNKGKKLPYQVWNKGIPAASHVVEAIIRANTGRIPWNKGLRGVQTHSQETRKRISEGMKGKSPSWLRGRKLSEEHKRKQSKALSGSNSYLWIDGRSKEVGYHSYIDHNRRQRKINNGGKHSYPEWRAMKEKFDNTCPKCLRKEPEIVLTRDHIVPVKLGGSDDISNIQPLCKSCNSSKKLKIICYQPTNMPMI